MNPTHHVDHCYARVKDGVAVVKLWLCLCYHQIKYVMTFVMMQFHPNVT